MKRSRTRAQLISRPERPKVQPLCRASLQAALLKDEPVIIVEDGQLHLPGRASALEWLQTLPRTP